jgi:drug/metabolite transporter (DMT)-like permease
MNSTTTLQFKTFVLILLITTFGPLGNLLLGKGMKGVGATVSWRPAELGRFLDLTLRSEFVWLGIACLLIFFVAYALVLSWADYSYVQPVTAFAYGTAALLGHFVLGEFVTPVQWTGIVVICLGVFVVGRTPPRTTETI